MIRLQAYGIRARIDLCDHHLVISRPGGIVGTASNQIVPFTSIKSVAFHRPTFFRPGRFVLLLAGGQPRQPGSSANDNTVFFGKEQLGRFEQLLQFIEAAIAMPSIERMAMDASWRKEANARITPARPEPKPTQAVVERIARPRQSYNPNTGAEYDGTGTYGHQAYHHPGVGRGDEPPLNPSVGDWWREVHPLGKIILIGIPLIVLLAMCSGPGEDRAPDLVEPAAEATEAAPAETSDPSYDYIDGMPPIGQLVMEGDSRACSHPGTLQTLRSLILPDTLQADALGVSAGELRRAIRAAKTIVTQITLENIRTDIHEMSCSGTLDYGGGNSIPIEYTLRPEADQNGDVLVGLDGAKSPIDGPYRLAFRAELPSRMAMTH